jgi:hypothetical protein
LENRKQNSQIIEMMAVANCSIYFYLFYYQNSNPATKALNLQKTFLGSFTENRKHFGESIVACT